MRRRLIYCKRNMKKYLPLLLAAVFAAGCAKQETGRISTGRHRVTFAVASDPGSKVSLGDEEEGKIPFLWTRGDKIGLFLSKDEKDVEDAMNIPASIVNDILESGPGFNLAYFTTELTLEADSEYGVSLYYPYRGWAGKSTTISHTVLPVQVQKSKDITEHLGLSGTFAAATSTLTTPEEFGEDYYHKMVFTLGHKTSYVLFRVSAADDVMSGYLLTGITLTVPEGKVIAGESSYDRESGEFTVAPSGSNSVRLDIPQGSSLSTTTPTDACMVVYPQTLTGQTVTIKYNLRKADGTATLTAVHQKTFDAASHAFEAGAVHRITEVIPSETAGEWTVTSSTVDLSACGTANSYRIDAQGTYSFDATVMGNGDKGILRPISESLFHTDNASISPVSAELLWQTAPGLITGVTLSSGRITFTKPDGTLGNAVIAAKDGEGNILWSWHIWCSDLGAMQAYVTPYNTYMAMDRPIGAVHGRTAIISDNSEANVKLRLACFGLYYQWGRKDPFPYANTVASSGTRTFITIYDKDGNAIEPLNTASLRPYPLETTSSEVGTQEWAAAHPTTFILNKETTDSSNDWYNKYGEGAGRDKRGYGFWGNPYGHLYNTADAVKPVKTIYDPCPPGYMVPPVDFYLALTASTYYYTGNRVSYDGGSGYTWVQRQGMLRSITGDHYYCNSNGYFWTSGTTSETNEKVCSMYMTSGGSSWVKQNMVQRGHGMPLRCIQEL